MMKRTAPKTSESGFTLIEVIVAIVIFSMVMAAVFYFYSNAIDNQGKLREKYTILRISRQFVDSFTAGAVPWDGRRGQQDMGDFVMDWKMFPVEDGREVVFTSGRPPLAQLNVVRLRVIKKETNLQVYSLDFLFNTIAYQR